MGASSLIFFLSLRMQGTPVSHSPVPVGHMLPWAHTGGHREAAAGAAKAVGEGGPEGGSRRLGVL